MPVYSRKYLRRTLGQNHIRDTYVGTTTASFFSAAYSLNIVDVAVSDLALSGQNAHVGAWLRVGAAELRVASFNVREGIYLSLQGIFASADQPASGGAYERHAVIPPADKDRALDEAIKRLRVRQEVGLPGVAGARSYPLPDGVEQVLDGYYYASPTGTLDRDRTALRSVDVGMTATGAEVRIDPAIGDTHQLVIDAITTPSLGTSDAATVNIPDERLVLFAAEAVCWDLLVRRAPRGTADEYRALRDAAARQYAALARNFKTPVDRPLRIA